MWMQLKAQVRNIQHGTFTYCYGHGERGLGEHVCERAAVEIVSEQILAVFVCVEPPRPEHLAQDGLLTVAVNAVRGLSGPVRSVIHEGIVIFISSYAFYMLLIETSASHPQPSSQNVEKSRRIGCVIPRCNLQWLINQPIIRLF